MNALSNLYSGFITTSKAVLPEARCAELCGPFLMAPTREFFASSPRIMIFGQETYGWCECQKVLLRANGQEETLKAYSDFNFGEKYRASPFWAFYEEIAQALNVERHALLWNNVLKFDHHADGVHCTSVLWGDLREPCLKAQDGVIRREVEILEVDFCIFLTGPNYDDAIMAAFPDAAFQEACHKFTQRQFAKVKLPLVIRAYRTYHPKYLRYSGLWTPVFETMIAKLRAG